MERIKLNLLRELSVCFSLHCLELGDSYRSMSMVLTKLSNQNIHRISALNQTKNK